MDPKFLRDEAARFRGMAETQDREASKLRLLKMADDYEAKADAGEKLTKGAGAKVAKKAAQEEADTPVTPPQ